MQRRVVTLVGTLPRREGFEGGQTSGVKAVKTQPIVPEPAGNGEKPSFEVAEPVATVPRRSRPLAEAVADGCNRTLPGRV